MEIPIFFGMYQISVLTKQSKTARWSLKEEKRQLPVYHTRAMIQEFIQKFGRVTHAVKPAVLRYFYKDLTCYCSSSDTTDQEKMMKE